MTALVVGVALIVASCWVFMVAGLIGIGPVVPDPSVPTGDPCCSYPDTWEEVRGGAIAGWVVGGVATVIAVGGGLLIFGTVRGRFARWRWLAVLSVTATALLGLFVVQQYGAARRQEAAEYQRLVDTINRTSDPDEQRRSTIAAVRRGCALSG